MEGSKLAAAILGEVRRAVVGKDEVLAKVLLAILAGGHILLEDIPGVGKTTMALAFSKALSLRYNRVQFTPDVMPSDITGFTLYNKEAGRMEYQPGAVLCNLFLADELNRATSRTQSALLEAMEEGQVTVDGVSHPVPQPFLVIATQNPAMRKHFQGKPEYVVNFMTFLARQLREAVVPCGIGAEGGGGVQHLHVRAQQRHDLFGSGIRQAEEGEVGRVDHLRALVLILAALCGNGKQLNLRALCQTVGNAQTGGAGRTVDKDFYAHAFAASHAPSWALASSICFLTLASLGPP